MRGSRSLFLAFSAAIFALVVGSTGAIAGAARGKDPLAAEIERWSEYVRTHVSKDDLWGQIKPMSEAALSRASDALRGGRRLLALQRLAAVRVNLAATAWIERLPEKQRNDSVAFESQWKRLAKTFENERPSGESFAGVQPAAVRAVAESALPQARVFYEASLEYGRNTTPALGLFYIGSAQAQKELAEFCRSLAEAPSGRAPALRELGGELDALEGEILSLYRPPASIDRHSDFIAVNAAVKEARELDQAGLRYGALLRYLQAAQRFAALRPAPAKPDADLARRLAELDARLAAGGVDHTVGRLFLEAAQADLAAPAAGSAPGAMAAAIVAEVMPRYFAALEPAAPGKPKPAPEVTVTLVRWPYT